MVCRLWAWLAAPASIPTSQILPLTFARVAHPPAQSAPVLSPALSARLPLCWTQAAANATPLQENTSSTDYARPATLSTTTAKAAIILPQSSFALLVQLVPTSQPRKIVASSVQPTAIPATLVSA